MGFNSGFKGLRKNVVEDFLRYWQNVLTKEFEWWETGIN